MKQKHSSTQPENKSQSRVRKMPLVGVVAIVTLGLALGVWLRNRPEQLQYTQASSSNYQIASGTQAFVSAQYENSGDIIFRTGVKNVGGFVSNIRVTSIHFSKRLFTLDVPYYHTDVAVRSGGYSEVSASVKKKLEKGTYRVVVNLHLEPTPVSLDTPSSQRLDTTFTVR